MANVNKYMAFSVRLASDSLINAALANTTARLFWLAYYRRMLMAYYSWRVAGGWLNGSKYYLLALAS